MFEKYRGGTIMKCVNCDIEMEKKEMFNKGLIGYVLNKTGGGDPVEVKKVYICPNCGKIELFVKK